MKFDLSLEAQLDEETGKFTASVKGDLPNGLVKAIEEIATAASAAVTKYVAAQEAKSLQK